MKLKKILAIALPVFLGATIVGAGFSVFAFEAIAKKENQADLEVTKKVPDNFGTLSVSFGSKNDILYAPDGTVPKLIVDQTGIEFPSPVHLNFKWATNADANNLSFGEFTYSFRYKIELDDEFASYFQFYMPTSSLEKSVQGLWYGASENLSLSDFENEISSDLSISFGYRSGMKPDTKESYQKVRKLIWNDEKEKALVRFTFEVAAAYKE